MPISISISQFDSSIVNRASGGQPQTRESEDERMNRFANCLKNRSNCDQENESILTTNELKEKLKNLLEETEKLENEKQNGLVDRGYEKARQCANQALKRADKELHNIKQIRQEQENIKEQMFLYFEDLKKNKAEILILEKQQNTLLQEVKNIEESSDTIDSNLDLLALELKDVSNDLSKIKVDQEKITEEFDELDKSVQDIQIEQKETEDQIDLLVEESTEKDTISQLGEQMIKEMANGKEGLCYSLQKKWQNIKDYTHALPLHAWEKMTDVGSAITSTATDIISNQAVSTFKLAVKSLCGRAWNYVNENTHPVTWIALGIFAGSLAMLALRTYPLTTLCIGGCLFLIVRNGVMPAVEFFNS